MRRLQAGVRDRRRHSQLPRRGSAAAGVLAMAIGDGKHVLVLEDEPAVQILLRKQLAAHGFTVTVAADGLDGLMKLESLRPDLIICDVMMPNLDGMGFVKAIKGHGHT